MSECLTGLLFLSKSSINLSKSSCGERLFLLAVILKEQLECIKFFKKKKKEDKLRKAKVLQTQSR